MSKKVKKRNKEKKKKEINIVEFLNKCIAKREKSFKF